MIRRRASALLVAAVVLAAPTAFGHEVMKKMMKSVDLSFSRGNMRATAMMLNTVAEFGPPEMQDWGTIAKKGTAAARRGDITNVKAACKSCHEKYRDAYKAKYGSCAPAPGPQLIDDE